MYVRMYMYVYNVDVCTYMYTYMCSPPLKTYILGGSQHMKSIPRLGLVLIFAKLPRHLSETLIFSFFGTTAICKSYGESRVSVRLGASFFLIQLLYTTHMEKAISAKIEPSVCSIQLLYTILIKKTKYLPDWRPPSFLYRCCMQSI